MDSGQSGIIGHPAQSRVAEGHSSERDTATIRLHKMAAPGASENHQGVNRATNGIVQVLLRGHVNNFFLNKNPKRLWKWVGGSSVQLEIKKIYMENIFLYIILLCFWASMRTSIML